MDQSKILRATEDAVLFEKLAASNLFAREDDPIYGSFGRRYFVHTVDAPVFDTSFCIVENDQPISLVECNVLQKTLGFFGMPIRLRMAENIDIQRQDWVRSIYSEFDRICGLMDVERIRVMGEQPLNRVTPVENTALARGGEISVSIHAVVSLVESEDELRRRLRKSYKSLINWGRRELRLEYVNADNPDRNLFNIYRNFHQRIAGRVTRKIGSWDVQYETIVAGQGELTLGYLDDSLLSGLLVIDGRTNSVYSSAVNDREAFDKPLGHWPLFNAFLRSKARGKLQFDIGEVPFQAESLDKVISIGKFKKGFTNHLEYRSIWDIPSGKIGN